MKIAIVSSEFGRGGVGNYLLRLVDSISGEHHIWVYYCPNYSEIKGAPEDVHLVPISMNTDGEPSPRNQLAWSVSAKEKVQRDNNDVGFDIVNPHISSSFFFPLFNHPTSTITTFHTSFLANNYDDLSWIRTTAGSIRDAVSCYRSDSIVVLNKELKMALDPYATDITVVPNGIRTSEYNPSSPPHSKKDLEDELGISFGDRTILLYIGRLAESKRPMALADFAANNTDKVQAIIAGKGELFHERLNKKWGNVAFPGYVSEEVKRSLLYYSDLFVLPSIREGLPTTILEALSMDLPVFATNTPGTNHVVTPSVGVLTKPDLTEFNEDLEKTISMVRENSLPEYPPSLRAGEFEWETIAEEVVNTFHRAIK